MEYLMTYGWAILIIAVVLGILFQLGVFSSGNFQPHAQAGSCQVKKTSVGSSLVGECQGQLPQFTVNVVNGYISTPSESVPLSGTITAWVYPININYGPNSPGVALWASGGNPALHVTNTGNVFLYDSGTSTTPSATELTPFVWQMVSATWKYDGSNTVLTTYINGAVVGIPANLIGKSPGGYSSFFIDFYSAGSISSFNALYSNVQLYNSSLTSGELSALYTEGIGGAPVKPQNLTGWWPLNGNLNDYSGSNNNGQVATGTVTYSSSWESGYTPP